jgi:hypothetical protein
MNLRADGMVNARRCPLVAVHASDYKSVKGQHRRSSVSSSGEPGVIAFESRYRKSDSFGSLALLANL